jgi:hypothetical protein
MAARCLLPAICLTVIAGGAIAEQGREQVLDIGSRLELFVDGRLIDNMQGVTQKLHSPVRQDISLEFNKPWEGPVSASIHVIKDDGVYRMYYRGCKGEAEWGKRVECYAESADGIHWTRPNLGLYEFEGSTENNILYGWELADTNLAPFKDPNPNVPEAERYKAIANFIGKIDGRNAVSGLASADGIHWKLIQPDPIFIAPADDKHFDAHQVAFWDSNLGKYVAYCRGWKPHRVIRRTTSDDFRNWSAFEYLDYGDAPPEHFYTCMVAQYPRAPHIYLGFEKRFLPERKAVSEHVAPGVSDAIFMSSRDGIHFDRRFMESWIRPGLDQNNWTERNFQVAWDIIETSPTELSFYWLENYRHPGCRVQRGTLRLDRFVSINAGYAGGEFTTKPLRFAGRGLVINYATSAAGSVRVEVQGADGAPIPGFTLDECPEIYGDHIERVVAWEGGADLAAVAGKPVRLRLALKDADLYALRFQLEKPKVVGPTVLGSDPLLDFPGGRMTVEAFVYAVPPPPGHTWMRILSKYNHKADGTRRGWEWNVLQDGRLQFRVNQALPGAEGMQGDRALNSTKPLPLKKWVHIATVFDRPTRRLRLYVDGKLESEREIPDAPMRRTPDQDLLLGRYGDGGSRRFYGKLDELRLTAAALAFDAPPTEPYTGREPDTVALYHFDELIDGSTVPNAVPHSRLRSRLRVAGDDRLSESMPGFGSALNVAKE